MVLEFVLDLRQLKTMQASVFAFKAMHIYPGHA